MKRPLLAAATLLVAVAALSPSSYAQNQGAPRPPARGLPFATLGPLSGQVVAGQSGAWAVRDDGGQAALSNTASAGAIRFYATDWQGDLASGRSASVRVLAKGGVGMSQAGLIFRLTNQEPRWVSFVLGADGKLAVYVRSSTELVRTATYDIPGGHRPAGDVLSINQAGDAAQLLANGYLVAALSLPGGLKPNVPAPVGVVAMGIGEFTLANFAFGKAIVPAQPAAPPPPQVAGNDDAVPTPTPAPVPAPAPGPAPRTQVPSAQSARPVEVATLGPLGHSIKLGNNSNWLISVENGQLVFNHDAEDDLYYFNRSVPSEESGKSATVTVDQRGKTKSSGGGLLFGLTEDGKAFWALEATGDGKIKLFHLKDGEFILIETFEAPAAGSTHILKMSATADGMALFADGKQLTVVETEEPDGYDTGGRLGISMRGNGRFAFQDFAFGAAEPPAPAPVPLPAPAAAAPPAPAPTPAPTTPQTADARSLGPLGSDIQLGKNEGWNTTVQNDGVTYAHIQDDMGGTFFRIMPWPAEAADGRSAAVTVDAQGQAVDGGGGIAFAVQEDGRNMLLWAACGDGKVRLFRVDDDSASTVQSFTPAKPGKRHELKVSQKDNQLRLLIDGATVKTMPGTQLGGLDGGAGIGMLRGGRYTFRDFSFGSASP